MTISDLNNLVHLTAQSKDSQGRAYSAGFTNAGVYERLDAFGYEGEGTDKTSVRILLFVFEYVNLLLWRWKVANGLFVLYTST